MRVRATTTIGSVAILGGAALLAAAAGCGKTLPDPSVVTRLRVLAVRAEPPELPPGGKIHFDALWADPNGGGRTLHTAWAICDPGSAGVGTCGDPTHVTVLGSNQTADFSVPANTLDGLDPVSQEIGRDLYVVFAVDAVDPATGDPTDHDVAFKRVRVSTNPAPNSNPRISELLVDGTRNLVAPLDLGRGMTVALHAAETAQSQEKWQSPDGASGLEDGRFTWLVTGGSLAADVTYAGAPNSVSVDDRWRLPGDGSATLWVVLRDGRGGVDWAEQRVTLH